ncbi:MAG: VCBS repeat-containing protein [Bacteroidetes bacterium]|nr:VCBS repeat-containing protein [Bacteroidota bacterium]
MPKAYDYLALGNIDNNELTDILFCSNSGQFWGIFYNYGYKNFSAPEYHYIIGYYPLGLACGNLNSDGRDDVVIGGQATVIYYSSPSGFQEQILNPMGQKDMFSINDFDGDGDNDLITAAGVPIVDVTSIVIYQNQGDTNLVELPEVYFQPGSSHFFVTDFNNDSLPDIAFLSDYPDTVGTGITDTTGGIYILYNQGGFQLSEPQFVPLNNYGEGWRNFHCADLDGNGFNDIAIVRTIYIPLAGNLEILFNDGNGHFVNTPLGIDNPKHAANFGTMRCYPNPFYETTTFEFEIKQTAQVELSVYDIQGKIIHCLIHEKLKGGQYSTQWRGLDKTDKLCKSGAIFACLKINGKIDQVIKIIKS